MKNNSMKAAMFSKYGPPDVYRLTRIKKPVPKQNEVLIKVHASTATSAEKLMRTGKPYWGRLILGLVKPKKKYRIPGLEIAGEIIEKGSKVTKFKTGDKIFGFCGFNPGACAEYKCLSENASIALKPKNLNWSESAASVDGATTALFFLKEKANIQAGQKILVIGASGSIGTFAIQLSKYFKAEVTGLCSSKNVELVKELGANHIIDYTCEDFTKGTNKYDIIFDTVGKSSYIKSKKVLNENGIYLPTAGLLNNLLMLWTTVLKKLSLSASGKRVICGMSVNKKEALELIKQLSEKEIVKPVIDKIFPLSGIIDAHKYVAQGHKVGNVAISIC
ncbi:MAG: NAD(P)-dependent alcohol dehydrogenase [Bacteroidales bacterium]|nr:NAD(P)-dependent alcohol dehydrogenase [Bacteroidales bacterium]MBN2820416.1 NAD(P)-dependent alcohol dehydrogenase [Bacteroidales bacterium]